MTRDGQALCDQVQAAIARVGWSETARRSGIRRETLHRAFGTCGRRSPNLRTIAAAAGAIGLELCLIEKPNG